MLQGLKVIAAHLGPDVSPYVVKQLAREGAPVRRLGKGRGRNGARYIADSDALASWVARHAG